MRLLVGGCICWGLLLAGAVAVVVIKDAEAAAARRALPAVRGRLGSQERYLWKRFPDFHDAIPILGYHGVNSKEKYLTVTRRRFADQMLALHIGGFHTITIGQYARYQETGSTEGLPSKPILLTFDDGRLDSFQGADKTLARYHDTAVMFVVADWPDTHPEWALHWNELIDMQESGRWEIQEHAGAGHTHISINPSGSTGEFYAYRRWQDGHQESLADYEARVSRDVRWGEHVLKAHIPGYRPIAFAVPYSNYGQRYTNDQQIPRYFLPFLHTQFPVVVDGDYLDEGMDRPEEIKGRWSPRLSYRVTLGAGVGISDLYCRLRDFVLDVPLWREYGCLKLNGGDIPYVRSE